MKRLVVAAAVVVGLVGMAMVAGAAVDIVNVCTSTYTLAGGTEQAANMDSAIVRVQGAPVINVTKLAYNERTKIGDNYQVAAIQGDVILFTIIWTNAGEATADTVVLNDYVPAGLTYVAASVTDSEANVTSGAATQAGGLVQYVASGAAGTDSGAAADGIVKFRATCN